ncbi:hypothetical protein Aph02nite_10570 [Actinoplanes philippinensis]|uniref:RepA protein n=1 Tax=Actinoplanes philippinensis TaxID=35752 RepID=A0A1I2A3D0_9ACTN|nr:hypothetical protein [Actinoplanes philippinensis]GIE75107.1 hypothetical protein Aph02nite_10570 [Actinoplanes philippinensis]SFE38545.1 hypothetical protein SAMN05421541_101488 [Actinoplanes philippinensis]
MSFSFRHGDVAVHITVDAADGHSVCRPPAGSARGETVLYPPEHADLVLPVTDPGDVELHYRAGLGSWRSGLSESEFSRYAGIPYGLLGRHLVMFLCTEAFRCRTRTITLHPHRVYAFLATVGSLSEQTVRGGWFTALEGQLQRTLRHGWIGEHPGPSGTLITSHLRQSHGLLDSAGPPQSITLDAEFAKSALRWIPLDSEVVRILSRHSCTALDVYAWLTYIGTYLDDARQFSWESVQARFALPAADPAAFRPAFEACLEEIRKVTAIPSVTADASGVEIRPPSGCAGTFRSAWPVAR